MPIQCVLAWLCKNTLQKQRQIKAKGRKWAPHWPVRSTPHTKEHQWANAGVLQIKPEKPFKQGQWANKHQIQTWWSSLKNECPNHSKIARNWTTFSTQQKHWKAVTPDTTQWPGQRIPELPSTQKVNMRKEKRRLPSEWAHCWTCTITHVHTEIWTLTENQECYLKQLHWCFFPHTDFLVTSVKATLITNLTMDKESGKGAHRSSINLSGELCLANVYDMFQAQPTSFYYPQRKYVEIT